MFLDYASAWFHDYCWPTCITFYTWFPCFVHNFPLSGRDWRKYFISNASEKLSNFKNLIIDVMEQIIHVYIYLFYFYALYNRQHKDTLAAPVCRCYLAIHLCVLLIVRPYVWNNHVFSFPTHLDNLKSLGILWVWKSGKVREFQNCSEISTL